jgi:hypothetical protein
VRTASAARTDVVDRETSLGWLCQELLAERRLPDFPLGYGAPHTAAYLCALVPAELISRLAPGEALDDQVSR